MSGMFTTIDIANLAAKLVSADNPGATFDQHEADAVTERLVEIMHEQHVDWDRDRLSIVQAAILRDWYWYPTTEGA